MPLAAGVSTHPLTDCDISDVAGSHDGTRLAITRVTTTNDIVLFRGLKWGHSGLRPAIGSLHLTREFRG
jgi:hypothetical protein